MDSKTLLERVICEVGRTISDDLRTDIDNHLNSKSRKPLTHVALRDDKGRIWSLPKPYRHHHILSVIRALGDDSRCESDSSRNQGFLDSDGRYLNRYQAFVNAKIHNQIKNGEMIGSVLTSEDLW